MVEDLVDFECHGLPRPHLGDFAEPTICGKRESVQSPSPFFKLLKLFSLTARIKELEDAEPLMVG